MYGCLILHALTKKALGVPEKLEPRPSERIRILLIVCHDGWAVLDARALATQMADACMRLGWEVSKPQRKYEAFSYNALVSSARCGAPSALGAKYRLFWVVSGTCYEKLRVRSSLV